MEFLSCLLNSFNILIIALHFSHALRNALSYNHILDAFDLNLLTKIMKDVKEKKSTQVPKYDYRLNARLVSVLSGVTQCLL